MQYKVLVVDNDTHSLLVLRASLEKWSNYYEVNTATHGEEALNMLSNNSYDLVLAEVHMPGMNGVELLQHINRDFSLPVILMSADEREEVMCMAMKNGAQFFLQKPILADDLSSIWQYCELWRSQRNNSVPRVTQITQSSQAMVRGGNDNDNRNNNAGGMSISDTRNNGDDGRKGRIVWESYLHDRFLEAILVIGYQRAVPTNIWNVMNVKGLDKNHVMSHLQKFQTFLRSVLNDDNPNVEISHWGDPNYYSSIVGGNPTQMLINQLREDHRRGKLDPHNPLRPPKPENSTRTHVRAPNGSNSTCPYRLPPLTIRGSSNMSKYATLMPNNHASSFVNAAPTELSNATPWNHMTNQMGKHCQTSFDQNPNYSYTGGSLWKANNVNSGSTASGTGPSLVHNLSYESNQMGYYGQTTVADQERNVFATGGLVGGVNNNIFISTNIVAPSSIPFNSEQSINYGAHARNNFFDGNNFDLHQENHVAMVEENQAATGDDHAVDDVDAFISSILDDNTF